MNVVVTSKCDWEYLFEKIIPEIEWRNLIGGDGLIDWMMGISRNWVVGFTAGGIAHQMAINNSLCHAAYRTWIASEKSRIQGQPAVMESTVSWFISWGDPSNRSLRQFPIDFIATQVSHFEMMIFYSIRISCTFPREVSFPSADDFKRKSLTLLHLIDNAHQTLIDQLFLSLSSMSPRFAGWRQTHINIELCTHACYHTHTHLLACSTVGPMMIRENRAWPHNDCLIIKSIPKFTFVSIFNGITIRAYGGFRHVNYYVN